ncbi:hypothetical protein OHB13_37965 (plasmid) [Streptomyces sp. NBC_00440]|uniref:hypothetical protein n=1 Tax=Streptomyces sp. NBC_00440 TaxID=2975741 RepID=UPI002E1AD261
MTPTATDQNERIARPHIRCRHKSSAGDQKEKLQRLGCTDVEVMEAKPGVLPTPRLTWAGRQPSRLRPAQV